ncbi:MAG: DUF4956 domain-containing protein [Bacteroidales bacterium]|jgi:hypothetical protein|nr:DUF4956 domain-containing protein [Bacteroidales bacterium]
MQAITSVTSIVGAFSDNLQLFNTDILNAEDLFKLIIRFGFNLIVTLVLVRLLYYKASRRKDYLFTYMMFSTVIFLLCFLLESVKIELGFALGLFAIFGIIRYRTTTIPIKEMTYLFVIIGVSVINALANKKISYGELLFTNLAIVAIVWGFERIWLLKHESTKMILYEKIDLIKPENYSLLLKDLNERTGLDINRIEVGKINFMRDTAEIKIYYYNGLDNFEEFTGFNDES